MGVLLTLTMQVAQFEGGNMNKQHHTVVRNNFTFIRLKILFTNSKTMHGNTFKEFLTIQITVTFTQEK